MNESTSPLDPDFAALAIGKRILVGITYLKYSGELIEQKQFHGVVRKVSQRGIELELPDGTTYLLPPDSRGISEAPPGVYRLRSTGEEVVDPDFVCSWTSTRPDA